MTALVAVRAGRTAVAAAVLSLFGACVSSSSGPCTCKTGEKWSGEACVAAADFVAPNLGDGGPCPDSEGGDQAVCGCDGVGYADACAAAAEGVQVKNAGTCSTGSGNNNGGGFGW